jgi:hypothetical protein
MRKILKYKFYIIAIIAIIFISKIINFFTPKEKSKDKSVNDAILSLDTAFDSFGTFDSDHEVIFTTIKGLSSTQIRRLHKDFGTRYHNFITGKYIIFSFLSGFGTSKPINLNGLYDKEFSDNQISKIKTIYNQKGLDFPFVL